MSESWDDLSREPGPRPQPNEKLNELCAQVFTTPVGRDLLALLRARHVDRRMTAAAPEAVLRVAEAERQLVLGLETARDRGLEALNERKKSAAPS